MGIKISVCMIVKDRETKIGAAIESVYNYVDEIIVVDTGSTDGTKDICRVFDKVRLFDFEWVDDFSLARNESLSHATGDYVFILDSDEVVINPEKIKETISENYDAYYVRLVYGQSTQKSYRMWKNGIGIKYVCACHEIPTNPQDMSRLKEQTDIQIEHRKDNRNEKENTSKRNVRILSKADKEHPNDCRTMFYLAYALKETGELDRAVGLFERYIYLESTQSVPYKEQAFIAQLNIGYIRDFQGYTGMAIQDYTSAINIMPERREPHFKIGQVYMRCSDYKTALKWFEKCKDVEVPPARMWVDTDCYGEQVYRNIVMVYDKQKDFYNARTTAEKAIRKGYSVSWFKPRIAYFTRMIEHGKIMVIECYRAGALGDVLMTTAAVKALKEKYPDSFIRYVTHETAVPLLENNPYIDQISLQGFPDAKRKVLFSYPQEVGAGGLDTHLIDRFNECAGVPDAGRELTIQLTGEDLKYIEFFKPQKTAITIHTTAGWSPYKNWYIERWNRVVKHLKSMGYEVYQIGHINDDLCTEAVDLRSENIRQQFAIMSFSQLHIGVDSVYCHAAHALGIPAVILWGSTDPSKYGYSEHKNIYKGIECQSCGRNHKWAPRYKDDCPNDKRCMDLISVTDVIEKVKEILK